MSVFENVCVILPLLISFLLIIKNDEPKFFADFVVRQTNIIKAFLSTEVKPFFTLVKVLSPRSVY